MVLDTTDFPLVRMFSTPGRTDRERQFDALLTCGKRLVLLSAGALPAGNDVAQDERKQHALWLKWNRPALSQWCAGAVIVQTSRTVAAASRAIAPAMTKAFGFPIRIVESEADVDAEAAHLLDRQ